MMTRLLAGSKISCATVPPRLEGKRRQNTFPGRMVTVMKEMRGVRGVIVGVGCADTIETRTRTTVAKRANWMFMVCL
jgi:hypothetical protein